MPDLPRILDQRLVAPGDVFKVEQLDLEFSNGVRRTYERLRSGGLGAVIVVPMTDESTVLLIREYACGLHRYELGLPKGRLERNESALEGANRELQEEAGFAARSLISLGQLSLAPTYMAHKTEIVLARDLYPSRLEGDEPERIEVQPWPIEDLFELAQRDDVSEGRTLAALYLARDYMTRNPTQ